MGRQVIENIWTPSWNTMLPEHLKGSVSLDALKVDIKSWTPEDCPCELCKIYVEGLGYISKRDIR